MRRSLRPVDGDMHCRRNGLQRWREGQLPAGGHHRVHGGAVDHGARHLYGGVAMSARHAIAALLLAGTAAALAQTTPRFDGERKRDPVVPTVKPAQPVLPPYRLAITPPQAADESQPIVVQPQPSTAIANAVGDRACIVSFRPDSGAGTSLQGTPDPSCSRADTVRLPEGTYRARLTMRWRPAGETALREDSHELPYAVRVGDRVRVLSLRVEPSQVETRVSSKLAWEVLNTGPLPVQPLVVEMRRDQQAVERRTRSSLAPGEVWRDSFAFTATEARRVTLGIVADPDNRSGEPGPHWVNNRAELAVDVRSGPPPTPVLLLGDLVTPPGLAGARPATWTRKITLCNVDPSARYVSEVRGPKCSPMPCSGPYSGTPARGDFRPGSVFENGSTLVPACPGGLAFAGALKPGDLMGPIGHSREHRFDYTVFAEKDGRRSSPVSVSFTVPPNCRPPCVEQER